MTLDQSKVFQNIRCIFEHNVWKAFHQALVSNVWQITLRFSTLQSDYPDSSAVEAFSFQGLYGG